MPETVSFKKFFPNHFFSLFLFLSLPHWQPIPPYIIPIHLLSNWQKEEERKLNPLLSSLSSIIFLSLSLSLFLSPCVFVIRVLFSLCPLQFLDFFFVLFFHP